MSTIMDLPRAPPIKYPAPLGTRWAKEQAAAGGASAFDFPTDPKSIGPWILGECVGKGASGRVKIAKHKRTGQLAAVKILPIAPLLNSRNSINTQYAKYEKFRLGIDREITMMKLMNHPNIMRIYDVFEGETELYLVLEYVEGGELYDFLVNRGRLPPEEAVEYFKQIIYGLNYAHTFSIIHRDLKPENILIASLSPPLIKIVDWGMAAFAPPSLQLDTSCGSPHYASPEIVNGEKYQGNATDIWSCGVVLYALLTGRLPFDDNNIRILLAKVRSGKYKMPVWIDPLAGDLISRMLVVNVAHRITIPEILAHPWLTSAASVSPQVKVKMLKQPIPPLPPSPSILARPIASPDLVDLELFSSLRIIWGKHADPSGDSIKKDLCSPAGQGVHTKAFYYLLNKYRDESYRKRLDDGEDANDMACNGISRLSFDRYWERSAARMASALSRQRAASAVPPSAFPRRRIKSSHIHPPDTVLRRLTPLPPLMERSGGRAPSRELPGFPAGPRPLPYTLQPSPKVPEHNRSPQHFGAHCTQSVGPARLASSIAVPTRRTTAGPRPPPPRRGYTFSQEPEKQIVSEEKPVDPRIMTYGFLGTYEEGRRNTIATVAPALGRKDDVRQTRIPSPIFRPPVSTPPESPKNQDCQAPPDIRSPRTYIRAQMDEGSPVNAPPLALTNPRNGRTQASAKVQVGTNQAADLAYHKATRRDTEPKDHGRKRVDNRNIEDKENQGVSATSGAPGARRPSGVGLGTGIGNTRDVCQEMGNVIYIGTGNTPIAKDKKERKNKPPALDLPVRRSTMSAFDSPMMLSPVASNNSGSPARLLTSPVVGEFKGWFSSLFNRKSSASGQSNAIYSPDDFSKTCVDVARLLETLGVIVVVEKPSDSLSDGTVRLKCRIEELSVDHQANISLKPVRFRVEFKPIQQTRPFIRQSAWSPPLSPITDNACFFLPPNDEDSTTINQTPLLSAPNPGLTPRIRMSMLPVVMGAPSSGQNTPMPSPGLNELHMSPGAGPSGNDSGNGPDIPYGTLCGILLVYEKGSTSSFKTIWRKVKDAYGGSPAKLPAVQSPKDFSAFSPIMVSTPVSQACPTGHFSSPGC